MHTYIQSIRFNSMIAQVYGNLKGGGGMRAGEAGFMVVDS